MQGKKICEQGWVEPSGKSEEAVGEAPGVPVALKIQGSVWDHRIGALRDHCLPTSLFNRSDR